MDLYLQSRLAPLRVGATSATLDLLFAEPLLFAAHYATVADSLRKLGWPAEVNALLGRVGERYRAHDAVLELMDTLRGQLPMALSVDLARRMAEGMELHAELGATRDMCDMYRQQCAGVLDCVNLDVSGEQLEHLGDDTPAGRLALLCRVLDFSPAEARLLSLSFALTHVTALQLFTRLFCDMRNLRAPIWQALLDLDAAALTAVLAASGRLIGSGLLQTRDGIPRLSEFWAELLARTDADFAQCVVQPLAPRDSPGGAARLPEEDRDLLRTLLARNDSGINVLLYGKSAVDKARLAQALIADVGGTAHTLVPGIPEHDQPAAVLVGQRLLARRDGRPILVVEKAPAVLTRAPRAEFLFFGLGDEDEDVRPMDERLLADNPVPTLWLTHDAQRLHRETLTRFLFHAEALKGTRADRTALVESMIEALPISAREKAELAKLEGLSAPQLIGARTLAKMTAGRSRRQFARHFRLAALRSQKALAQRGKDEARLPVTQYSLDYLHAAGRFGPAQILKALRRRPHGSLCLYGLPGTGKTQFAEHIALELGKPLLAKRASELFDKYVGESEKRIGEAFDQAEEEGAVLLLDEADSFLRDRSRSTHSWEVSTVNELLQRMERFEEIFICTTNLYQQLDIAALRRFTFKLEFLPLTLEQRWAMFLNETGLRGKPMSETRQSSYEERLVFMQDLTPGDFATVKRQCVLLGEELSAEDWLSQLELEVQAKRRAGNVDQESGG